MATTPQAAQTAGPDTAQHAAQPPVPDGAQLTPRSAVFDLLGDYVRYDGGAIALRALVTLTEALGVRGGTARVVLSRMREQGWFTTRRNGREATYDITAQCLRVLDEGRERIFTRRPEPWDGHWSMVIYAVPESERATREKLRKALLWLGFGALAPSTWISPHNRLDAVAAAADTFDGVRLDLLTMSSGSVTADRELADRCWDLDGLDTGYRAFLDVHAPRLARHHAALPSGADALRARVGLVHAYRKFPFVDPDLPAELTPPGWVGQDAHRVFLEAHELLREPAQEYYRDVVARFS